MRGRKRDTIAALLLDQQIAKAGRIDLPASTKIYCVLVYLHAVLLAKNSSYNSSLKINHASNYAFKCKQKK